MDSEHELRYHKGSRCETTVSASDSAVVTRWSYCTLCDKWATDAHIASEKHQQMLMRLQSAYSKQEYRVPPPNYESRCANDGKCYTRKEFDEHYGKSADWYWERALGSTSASDGAHLAG